MVCLSMVCPPSSAFLMGKLNSILTWMVFLAVRVILIQGFHRAVAKKGPMPFVSLLFNGTDVLLGNEYSLFKHFPCDLKWKFKCCSQCVWIFHCYLMEMQQLCNFLAQPRTWILSLQVSGFFQVACENNLLYLAMNCWIFSLAPWPYFKIAVAT